MLTELRIQNFKAWQDTGTLRMAPLTVIFGENSAGKSSLGHLLLTLKQTVLMTDRRRSLHLGDGNSLIDLGTFVDCLHGHDRRRSLQFTLGWQLRGAVQVRNSLDRSEAYEGNALRLNSVLRTGPADQPITTRFEYQLMSGSEIQLAVTHTQPQDAEATLAADPMRLVKKPGRQWPMEAPEKFYRFSDVTLARFQNADFLTDLALETERLLAGLYYLGPLRSHPRRIYQWSGEVVPDVGENGEFAIPALLAATAAGRKLGRGHKKRQHTFDVFIADWLRSLGVIDSFSVRPLAAGRKEYEVLLRTHKGAPEVKLTDVGFGVSQVLPALVQAFYAPPGSIVWMEQPEIHLHPRVQSELADVFISAVQARENGKPRNVQLIVESHSEHFLSRLQRRVAEGELAPEEIAIYFCRRSEKGPDLEPLHIDLYGDIDNWPEGFFGDEMGDAAARTIAAMQRKIRERDAKK